MSTRDKIMDVALHMFSERGYEAVSIRDICGEVGIKESTLYYHFKNKKDILDSLVAKFKAHIDSLLVHVDEITAQPQKKKNKKNDDIGAQMMDSYMMDSYLFDPFCNLMLRLMMIEQFHNEEIRELYEKTLFTDPYEIQLNVFNRLAIVGTIPAEDVEWIVRETHAYMTMLTFKYLLNGNLTEERKASYHKEVFEYMANIMGKRFKS
ncbi:MAG: TetR/AcrR family transcriptional regulator [Clostridiales bacterium]|nr:TetR/AcrR family transcriptional regulator [Clostridiales bacterium]